MRDSLKLMTESDFYMNLYEDFIETGNDENDKILWKTYKIIDLMKISNITDTSGFMENGLRMIMLLFKHFKLVNVIFVVMIYSTHPLMRKKN